MVIQNARLDDLKKILDIDSMVIGSSNRSNYIEKSIKKKHCFIARHNDVLVGFAIVDSSFFGQNFIPLVIVHPQFRRMGIASGLMRHIIDNGSGKLFTSTNQSNEAMQKVCESLGFVRSGVIYNLDDGDPELILLFCR